MSAAAPLQARSRAATTRSAGMSRSALRPTCVAAPRRSTAVQQRAQQVVPQAQDKNTIAAVTLTEAVTVAEAATHAVTALDPAMFHDFLQQHSSKLTVIDFYTEWCGPCKMIAPELERMARESDTSKVVYAKVNCGADNDSKKLAVSLGIKALPTFHLYREGKLQTMMTGAKAKALQDLIDKHM